MKFDPKAMKDVDKWVRGHASQMLFVNGQNDPWSAEPFSVGNGSEEAYVYKAPGANHGASIAKLSEQDRAAATRALLKWAGVEPAKSARPKRLTKYDADLDRSVEQQRMLRP
jgi:hypothetical protein